MADTPFMQIKKVVETSIRLGKTEREDWDRWTSWYLSEVSDPSDSDAGNSGGDSDDISLETNYPYAYLDTMAANIGPQNPTVTIDEREEDRKESAKMRERLVNDTFRRNKFHSMLWDQIILAGITGRAFLKTAWNNKQRRPKISLVDPRRVFYDRSVPFDETRYIFEIVPYNKAEFDKQVEKGLYDKEVAKKCQAQAWPDYLVAASNADTTGDNASYEVFKWYLVIEYYDLVSKKFYHFIEGQDKPLLESALPYKYVENPYSMLKFNSNMRDSGGLSDVKLIERPMERLNEIDSLELTHAHTSNPVMLINKALLAEPEKAASVLQGATGPGAIAVIDAPGQPIGNVIGYTQTPNISPSYGTMRDRITSVIEFLLGMPAYERGGGGESELATEVALIDTASRTRNGRRIKIVLDEVEDIGKKVCGLWKQFMDPAKKISVRDVSNGEMVQMDRAALMFPKGGAETVEEYEDEWYYDFTAVPYSPSEDNRLVVLQRITQHLPLLINNPSIDQQGLLTKLLELLGLGDIKVNPAQQQAGGAAPPGGVPGQPGVPGMAGVQGSDTMAGGGMPGGLGDAGAISEQPKNGASLPAM